MELTLVNARVSFANGLYEPSSAGENSPEKYGADFIVVKGETKVFKKLPNGKKEPITLAEAELEVANEAWKGKGADMLEDLDARQKAIRNGNKRKDKDGEIREGYAGNWYITAKNKRKPTIFDRRGQIVTDDDGLVYSGCYVNVNIDLYANTKPSSKGVFATVTGVQFSSNGDSFGGGSRVAGEGAFEALEGTDADDIA